MDNILEQEKIKNNLQANISKYFENDGGGIEFISYENNVLKVRMIGKCHNCPSAIAEVETVVLDALQKDFPTIEKIEIINEVSEDLLNLAKKILSK